MGLKEIDYQILSELMKNSRISDRQLAKRVGSSQPTVSRRRAKLEKEFIEGYTTIPRWKKLGYEILAFTFVKTIRTLGTREKYEDATRRGTEWLMEHPNIIMSGGCRGMNTNGFILSVHKSYSDLDNFLFEHKRDLGDMFTDIHTIIVNLGGDQILKPLHFKYLADVK
jgi:DNA-binding Lrp family transcriptional regulator